MTVAADHRAGHWSTHQFTEYFSAVSGPECETDVVRVAIERAAEAFDAEFALAVADSQADQSIGFGRDEITRVAVSHLPVGCSSTVHPTFGAIDWLVAPLNGPGSRSTSVGGRLVVGRMDSLAFQPEEEQMLRAMATVVGLVLRNLRSLAVERARQNLLRGLLEVQRMISTRRPLQDVLDAVTQATSGLLGAATSCLVLADTTQEEPLSIVSQHSLDSQSVRPPGGIEAARQAMASRSLVHLSAEASSSADLQVVAVPVELQGEYAGALVAWHSGHEQREGAQADLLQMFAEQVSVALTDADTVARMNEALHDPVTGLASRALFLDRLNHAATVASRHDDVLCLLFLDLDGFKQINDSHGHAAGDEVLRVVGARVQDAVRASDTTGRLGGDEFVVLLEGISAQDAALTAQRLHAALRQPITIERGEVKVQASIGLADDVGGHTSPLALLALADAAMYRAKRLGPGRTCVHGQPVDHAPGPSTDCASDIDCTVSQTADQSGHAARSGALAGMPPDPGVDERVQIDIVDVVTQRNLRTVFQPLVRLEDRQIVGYEALTRGPRGTSLEAPVDLFDQARAGNLLPELDWACRASALNAALAAGRADEVTWFVNIEPAAIGSPCPPDLSQGLEYALNHLDLVVELTERDLAADPAGLLHGVHHLREMGARIALDDVGADPSSLALLPLIEPDVIKLDMRLIVRSSEAEVTAIVSAVRAQAEATGAVILAEGIETEQDQLVAETMGATLGQGWLFGRPAELPAGAAPSGGLARRRSSDTTKTSSPAGVGRTPFQVVAASRQTQVTHKRLLIPISRYLEQQASVGSTPGVLLACLQHEKHYPRSTTERYADLAEHSSFVGVFGHGLAGRSQAGVRLIELDGDDLLAREWNVIVLGAHFAAALVAQDLHDDGPDRDRRFHYAITHDRPTVIAAARSLMSWCSHATG